MLKPHDVDKLIAYKNGDLVIVEVYIKKTSLSKPQYAAVRDQRSFNSTPGPQFIFNDASYESLKKSVSEIEKDMPDDQKNLYPVCTARKPAL